MWSYLIGGGIGALGVIAALWFRYKLAKAEGAVAAGKLQLEAQVKRADDAAAEAKKAVAAELAAIEEHKIELARRETEITTHIGLEKKLRELLNTCSDPVVVARRVGALFPKP